MNQQDKHPISDYQLERYLLREGTDDELAALDRRVADDPALAQRLAALERSNEELHQRYPPEWMRGQIELKLKRLRPELSRRAQGRRVQRTWSGYRLWAVPAVALILAVVAVPTLLDQETPEAPETRIKGSEQEPRLLVFRKLASGAERLQDEALARKRGLGAARLPLGWLAVRGDPVRRWARYCNPAPAGDWSRGRAAGGARYPRRCLRIGRRAAVGAVLSWWRPTAALAWQQSRPSWSLAMWRWGMTSAYSDLL